MGDNPKSPETLKSEFIQQLKGISSHDFKGYAFLEGQINSFAYDIIRDSCTKLNEEREKLLTAGIKENSDSIKKRPVRQDSNNSLSSQASTLYSEGEYTLPPQDSNNSLSSRASTLYSESEYTLPPQDSNNSLSSGSLSKNSTEGASTQKQNQDISPNAILFFKRFREQTTAIESFVDNYF